MSDSNNINPIYIRCLYVICCPCIIFLRCFLWIINPKFRQQDDDDYLYDPLVTDMDNPNEIIP